MRVSFVCVCAFALTMLGWMVWISFDMCCLMLLMLLVLVLALTFGCGMIWTTRDAGGECFAVAAA